MMAELLDDSCPAPNTNDHPIFNESIRFIKARLGKTGLDPLQQAILERLIHSSGDFGLTPLLRFTPESCEIGLSALKAGAPILTDTAMAAAAVKPMARRTLNSNVRNVMEWAPDQIPIGSTRSAIGMKFAWNELSIQFNGSQSPVVLIGSAPTALEALLKLVIEGASPPSLIVGMPVGFVGVLQSKKLLKVSQLPHIRLNGNRGGAGMVAAVANALLRAAKLNAS